MVEDLSRLKDNPEPPRTVMDTTLQPVLWAYKEHEGAEAHSYAFGFPCGEYLCLVPLDETVVDEERIRLWASPVCKNEEDAKRIFFLIDQLMNALAPDE